MFPIDFDVSNLHITQPSTSPAFNTSSATNPPTQPTFDMNDLDTSISDWNGLNMNVNTAILNRDTVELPNQVRNQVLIIRLTILI